MSVLFVDNFRGFSNTYIPIHDVNFLVGENSTGKTSILGLMKLLAHPAFWFKHEFNTDDVNFGHFDDIVSVSAKDRRYFSIGLINSIDKKADKEVDGFLLTFSKFQGIPRPSLYAYSFGGNEIRIDMTSKKIRYKERSTLPYKDIKTFVREIFSNWVTAHAEEKTDYVKLPRRRKHFSESPIFIASEIEQLTKKKTSRFSGGYSATIPTFLDEMVWLAPIRTKPRRTYDEYKLEFSSQGDHTPYLVKRTLEKRSTSKTFKKFLDRVGRDSGLFETIQTKNYGPGPTAPFELDVMINGKAISISNVGYGVSQALPVIVEVFTGRKNTWFAIQQPEVHLHPRAQAALGDVFFELAVKEKKKFIIETHSDYTIDRFRLNYKMKKSIAKAPRAQILYFERRSQGNKVYQLEIQNNGELPHDQPRGYRDFFIKEDMRLLGL
ncbi:MAG: ATP-binding protein [Candidatus Manganitrophus sp. SB1]|nr:ATP-binding protein [Candidatus Manganitrophus morganii]